MEPDVLMPAARELGRQVILVVDDSAQDVATLQAALSPHYAVESAPDAARGLQRVEAAPRPDLILLGAALQGVGAAEVCRRIKALPVGCDIPVIILSAAASTADEEKMLALGAADVMATPVSAPQLRVRVRSHLQLSAVRAFFTDQQAFLESEVRRRTQDIQAIQEVTIMMLASLAETRDVDTGHHIRRTQLYVKALAEQLAVQCRFAAQLDPGTIDMIYRAVPLHDIGKVGIPDAVLRKQAHLRPDEFALMKAHTRLGREAIARAERMLGHDVPFLRLAKEIAFCHQEKWDGSGYPQGLRGDAIPLCARLMALADVYDALITRRVYREPVSHEEAVRLILEGRGSHFDPDVVDAFVTIAGSFRAIARTHADEEGKTEIRHQPRSEPVDISTYAS